MSPYNVLVFSFSSGFKEMKSLSFVYGMVRKCELKIERQQNEYFHSISENVLSFTNTESVIQIEHVYGRRFHGITVP